MPRAPGPLPPWARARGRAEISRTTSRAPEAPARPPARQGRAPRPEEARHRRATARERVARARGSSARPAARRGAARGGALHGARRAPPRRRAGRRGVRRVAELQTTARGRRPLRDAAAHARGQGADGAAHAPEPLPRRARGAQSPDFASPQSFEERRSRQPPARRRSRSRPPKPGSPRGAPGTAMSPQKPTRPAPPRARTAFVYYGLEMSTK